MKHASLMAWMILAAVPAALGQSVAFSPAQVISSEAQAPQRVHAADLDGDGDVDVLSGSYLDDMIAWHENLGGGSFGPLQVISSATVFPTGIDAADLDGDGDPDVLSASNADEKVAWYENLGSGNFGPQQVISSAGDGAYDVSAADLDGDGDADVLSVGGWPDDKLGWYENLGGAAFGPLQVISTELDVAKDVHDADLDGDGDLDVLSASYGDDRVAWYENLGGGSFGPQQVLALANGAKSIHTADLDGDGDADVLWAAQDGDDVAWHENLGGGAFGLAQFISLNGTNGATTVFASDFDGDGDLDVLTSGYFNGEVAWHENLGAGAFGPEHVISDPNFEDYWSVYAADLDGDGDADVLSASTSDNTVAWYRNLDCTVSNYCAQTKATSVAGCSAALGITDCTLEAGAWTATDIPRDASLGTGTVVGICLYTSGVGIGPSTFSASVPFGTLCLNGFARSGPVSLAGAVGGVCNAGPMDLPLSSLTTPPLSAGMDVNVQLWYRDPLPANSGNANLSNAIYYTVQ